MLKTAKKLIINISVKTGLVIFGLIIAILITEVCARLWGVGMQYIEPVGYSIPDAVNGYDLSKNYPLFHFTLEGTTTTYWSNAIGCFDVEYRGEKDFMLLVGDSMAWGYSPFEKKWGTIVERTTGVRTLKCGVSGYGTAQEVNKAKKIVRTVGENPRLIILSYYYNDMSDDWTFPGITSLNGRLVTKRKIKNPNTGAIQELSDAELQQQYKDFQTYCRPFTPRYPILTRIACFLKNNFVIYPMMRDAGKGVLEKITGGNEAYKRIVFNPDEITYEHLVYMPLDRYAWLQNAWQKNFQNLVDLKKFSDSIHAKLLVVLIPDKLMVYPALQAVPKKEDPGLDFRRPREMVSSFLEKNDIAFIDLQPSFSEYAKTQSPSEDNQKDFYWHTDAHLNIRGNELAGLLVSAYILEHGLLPMTPELKTTRLQEVQAALQKIR